MTTEEHIKFVEQKLEHHQNAYFRFQGDLDSLEGKVLTQLGEYAKVILELKKRVLQLEKEIKK